LTPLSSTPSSRKMLNGDAADVVDVENVDEDFCGVNVVREVVAVVLDKMS